MSLADPVARTMRGRDPDAGAREPLSPRPSQVDAGIPTPQVALAESTVVSGEGTELAWSTLEATSEAIPSGGVATSGELVAALASLRQFTDDQTTLIARPRVFQR